MAVYRCLIATFISLPEHGIVRQFEVGQEIATSVPLDELTVGKRGPKFLKVSSEAPEEAPEPLDLKKQSVETLREIAASLGMEEESYANLKKMELVSFLEDFDGVKA